MAKFISIISCSIALLLGTVTLAHVTPAEFSRCRDLLANHGSVWLEDAESVLQAIDGKIYVLDPKRATDLRLLESALKIPMTGFNVHFRVKRTPGKMVLDFESLNFSLGKKSQVSGRAASIEFKSPELISHTEARLMVSSQQSLTAKNYPKAYLALLYALNLPSPEGPKIGLWLSMNIGPFGELPSIIIGQIEETNLCGPGPMSETWFDAKGLTYCLNPLQAVFTTRPLEIKGLYRDDD